MIDDIHRLRGLGFGQVRQLDAGAGQLSARAWGAGARPERLVIDLLRPPPAAPVLGPPLLPDPHQPHDDLVSVEAEHPGHAQIDMDQIRDLEAAADRSVVDRAARLPD